MAKIEGSQNLGTTDMNVPKRMVLNQSTVEKSLKEVLEDFQYKKAAKKTISVFTDKRNWTVETSVSALKKLDGNTMVEAHIVEMGQDYSVAISI